MSSDKRGRGRPVGTGRDDRPTLEKIADLMAAQPSLKPTTVMRRILGQPGQSVIRRLQGKWKAESANLLERARRRREAAKVPPPSHGASVRAASLTAGQIVEAQRRAREAMEPAIRAAQELANSPSMLAAQQAALRYYNSPAMRAINEYRNSPAMRAIEEFQNSPTMRALREFQNSPTMKAMRELHDSPTFRAAQDVAQKTAKLQRLLIGGRT